MNKNNLSTENVRTYLCNSVDQAVERHQLDLSALAQHYLVEMLERFADTLQFMPQQRLEPVCFQYQRLADQMNKLQRVQLQAELGDHCLFLVGYFYDFVRSSGKAQVKYHSQIGSSAYQQTGIPLFTELARNFNDLYLVIADLHLPELDQPQKLMDIYQKWTATKDSYYASLLLGKGITPLVSKGRN